MWGCLVFGALPKMASEFLVLRVFRWFPVPPKKVPSEKGITPLACVAGVPS